MGGVSVSRASGEADYRFKDDTASGTGRLSSSLTSFYPYVRSYLSSGWQLWAVGGFGSGDIENDREHIDGRRDEGDLDMRLAAGSLRKPLSRVAGAELSLTGDAGFVSLSADGDGSLDGAEASVSRVPLGLEMAPRFAGGVEPFVRLYGRHDGGDGPTGAAAEMVLGMRYAGERLSLAASGNYLASAEDFEQWGADARVGYRPGSGGEGLTWSLTTQWGASDTGGSFLGGHMMRMPKPALGSTQGESPTAEFSGEIGYGLSVPRLRGGLAPTLGYDRGGQGDSRARFGLAYRPSPNLEGDLRLRLDIARTERRETGPDHGIELNAEMRF